MKALARDGTRVDHTLIVPLWRGTGRQSSAIVLRWFLVVPRVLAYLVAALIVSIVAGFVQGWRDVA